MAIKGALRDIDLASMIETLCARGSRVAVALERTGEEGKLFLDNGKVVHAELGPLQGEEAVFHLLSWHDGSFQVLPGVTPVRQTVAVAWQALVLEGARQFDEARHELEPRAAPTAAANELSWHQVEADRALEGSLVQMLSRLDQLGARLAEPRLRSQPEEGLRLLAEIVNSLATPAAPPHAPASYDPRPLFDRLASLHRHQLRHDSHRLVVVPSIATGALERRQAFAETRRILVTLLTAGLDHLGRGFHSPLARQDWQESYAVFVRDVMRNAESLRPKA